MRPYLIFFIFIIVSSFSYGTHSTLDVSLSNLNAKFCILKDAETGLIAFNSEPLECFESSGSKTINCTEGENVFVKFKFPNQLQYPKKIAFKISSPLGTEVELIKHHGIQTDSSFFIKKIKPNYSVLNGCYYFDVSITNEGEEFYLNIKNVSHYLYHAISVAPQWDNDAQLEYTLLFNGIFYSSLLLTFIFGIIYFINIKQQKYLLFSLYVLLSFIMYAHSNGFLRGIGYAYSKAIFFGCIYLSNLVLVNFTFNILLPAKSQKRISLLFNGIYCLAIPAIAVIVYNDSLILFCVLAISGVAFQEIISIHSVIKGNKNGYLFLLSHASYVYAILIICNGAPFPQILPTEVVLKLAHLVSIGVLIIIIVQHIKHHQLLLSEQLRNQKKELVEKNNDLEKYIQTLKRSEAKEKELFEQLTQSQKMETMGRLAGGIAHDFNNILTPIIGHAELALMELEENHPACEDIELILDSSNRAAEIVKQILTFSSKYVEKTTSVNVQQTIGSVIKLLRSTLPKSISLYQIITDENLYIEINPTQFHQVVLNICANAKDALPASGGKITIEQKRINGNLINLNNSKKYEYVMIRISDNGCGMPRSIIKNIFDPFFTTKPKGKGTGLGLSVVHGIVNNYNGVINVTSTEGKGSVFSIYFPSVEPEEEEPIAEVGIHPKRGEGKILIVDDEISITTLLQHKLGTLGYLTKTALNGVDGYEIFKEDPTFDLIITDQSMPELTGDLMIDKIRAINPAIKVVLTTGYSDILTPERLKQLNVQLLNKPFDLNKMAVLVKQTIES